MLQSVSDFISFVTFGASARITKKLKRTMCGQDIINSMICFGFDDHIPVLENYLEAIRKIEGVKVPGKRGRKPKVFGAGTSAVASGATKKQKQEQGI